MIYVHVVRWKEAIYNVSVAVLYKELIDKHYKVKCRTLMGFVDLPYFLCKTVEMIYV